MSNNTADSKSEKLYEITPLHHPNINMIYCAAKKKKKNPYLHVEFKLLKIYTNSIFFQSYHRLKANPLHLRPG